jgi:hypothetical protein
MLATIQFGTFHLATSVSKPTPTEYVYLGVKDVINLLIFAARTPNCVIQSVSLSLSLSVCVCVWVCVCVRACVCCCCCPAQAKVLRTANHPLTHPSSPVEMSTSMTQKPVKRWTVGRTGLQRHIDWTPQRERTKRGRKWHLRVQYFYQKM